MTKQLSESEWVAAIEAEIQKYETLRLSRTLTLAECDIYAKRVAAKKEYDRRKYGAFDRHYQQHGE